ncbi:hypothetical protein CPC08DRAFT_700183 [Agrocybe pediades]|nr:hypothetical protein CPC08DRAFT_700183 [Agrocybe pediades]
MTQPGPPVPPQINLSHSILSGGTFNQHNYIHSGERPGYARLLENVATAALHDSVHVVDPPKCYPNTRVAIIQNTIDWTLGIAEELKGKPILWLKGAAGAGKSAIARSVAERCSDEGLLLGTFFFRAADSTRNHVGKLVATLSYQISIILPEFRDTVAAVIEDDPLIFDRSIRTQFSTLIIRPLSIVLTNRTASSTVTPRLIIIDGLDECNSVDSQRGLLLTLQEVTNTTTLIRFLICSRPESSINNTFSLSHMVPILYKIFLDRDYSAWKDIRVYLEDKFRQIKEGHSFRHMLPDPWPMPETIDTLLDKSSGQFIYAATVIKYIESPRHRPDQRLNSIFKLRPPFKDLPFTELDALYRLIISKAEDTPTVLDILVFLALYDGFRLAGIEKILQLEQGTVEVMLADLHSIVKISNGYARVLHKSLADFLFEPQRAGDLYQDLSKAQLYHIVCVLSFFSTHRGRQKHPGAYLWYPISQILIDIRNPDNMKANYVSSETLRATQQFPTFEFFQPLFSGFCTTEPPMEQFFINDYFEYLYAIKDVCESTRLIYWEQMQQYCKCVLAVLDDKFSSDLDAHFVFVYTHLLHDPRYRLPRKLSYINFDDAYFTVFTNTVLNVTGLQFMDSPYPYFDDITKIFHDLIGNIKKEVIFEKAATFCLASLCNERHTRPDGYYIHGIAGYDQHKKREHPWHWRQVVPRLPSPQAGNRLVLAYARSAENSKRYKLTTIRKALRNTVPYRLKKFQILTIHQYFDEYFEESTDSQYWATHMFLLDLLPYILPLAGRYEPLVDMCRTKCLASFSQFWPKKSRRARQAIDSYLRRMDSQEGCSE